MNTALETRAVTCSLGSLLLGYPEQDFQLRLMDLGLLAQQLGALEEKPEFFTRLEDAALDDVRSSYFEAFEHRGVNPLHESSWGQGQGPGRGVLLADVAAFYQAFGLQVSPTGGEMLDHAGVQLEFYAVLLVKQAVLDAQGNAEGSAIVAAARRSFLKDHLAPLLFAAAGSDAAVTDPQWQQVVTWVRDVITKECALEDVTTTAHGRFSLEPEGETMNCAENVKLPVLQ